MDLSKLEYDKTEGKRFISSESTSDTLKPDLGKIDISNDESYSKGESYRSISILFIISGGEDREKKYFDPIQKDIILNKYIKILFETKRYQGYKPSQMAELCRIYYANNEFVITDTGERFVLSPEDSIYLIQDVDEFEDEIKREIDKGLPINSKWIISNPCFEIWLFYHYFDSPNPFLNDIPKERSDRGNWMKRKNNELVKGGIPTKEILYKLKDAILNSQNNYSESDNIPDLFSTQMFVLAQEIIKIVDTSNFEIATKKHYEEKTLAAIKYRQGKNKS